MKTSYYASRNSAVLIAYIFVKKISFTICITLISTTAIHLYVQVGRLLEKKSSKLQESVL